MTTGQLVLIIVLVIVAAVLVALILRRGAQRREEHRVEAEELRAEAEAVAPAVTGQAAFAHQAEERAGLARAEAEEKVREAEHLEAEAAQRQRTAEQTRQEYEAMMRRADDIDPDVKESEYPPVREDASPEPAPAEQHGRDLSADDAVAAPTVDTPDAEEGAPMTRAERRRAREEAEARESDEASWASGPAAPVAGAAAAAAVGTAAWAHDDHGTDAERERSARIASAADYRDPTDAADGGPETDRPDGAHAAEEATGAGDDVWETAHGGREKEMSQPSQEETLASTDPERSDRHRGMTTDAAADAESPRGEWGGPPAGAAPEADGSATADDTPTTEEGTTMAERPEGEENPPTTEPEADETTQEEDAPHATDLGSGMTMIPDPDAYAATEPVLADDQAAPVEPERPEHTGTGLLDRETGDDRGATTDDEEIPPAGATPDEHTHLGDVEKEDVDAVIVGDPDDYASTEPALSDGSHAEAREHSQDHGAGDADRAGTIEDPGADDGLVAGDADDREARDWGHDEGDLLDENRDRGERLAADREALEREAGDDQSPAAGHGTTASAAAPEPASGSRRVSDFTEIRDGGFGIGSAAPLDDGAQPMDHPVAGYRDTMSFRSPGDAGYDDTDPDVWFYDEGAAERAGFHRSDG